MWVVLVLSKSNPGTGALPINGWHNYGGVTIHPDKKTAEIHASGLSNSYRSPNYKLVLAEIQYEVHIPVPPVELLKFSVS